MNTRHKFFIRTVASVTGDFAVGFAMAVACTWVIQYAALGLFLSFLLWILTLIAALSVSQYVVHPLVQYALCDRKLDQGIDALTSLARGASELSRDFGSPSWRQLRQGFGRFTSRFASR